MAEQSLSASTLTCLFAPAGVLALGPFLCFDLAILQSLGS